MSASLEFADKVVLITGSSGGLGAQMARQFARQGAAVVVTGRNECRVHEVAAECNELSPNGTKALQVVADVTNDDDCKRLVDMTIENLGKIDVLVNNAGAGSFSNLDSPDLLKNLDHMYRLDIRSVVLMTQLVAPHLEKTKGAVVSTSSICSLKPVTFEWLSGGRDRDNGCNCHSDSTPDVLLIVWPKRRSICSPNALLWNWDRKAFASMSSSMRPFLLVWKGFIALYIQSDSHPNRLSGQQWCRRCLQQLLGSFGEELSIASARNAQTGRHR